MTLIETPVLYYKTIIYFLKIINKENFMNYVENKHLNLIKVSIKILIIT